MNKAFLRRPIAGGPIIVSGARAVCHFPDRSVEVEGPQGLLPDLLSRCDGETALEAIIDELSRMWDARDVGLFIEELQRERILVDAEDLAASLWAWVKNPQRLVAEPSPETLVAAADHAARQVSLRNPHARYFSVAHTPLSTLLARRESTRGFSREEVPLANVLSALWSAYGVPCRRSVPSAGGLYPLQFHLLQLRSIADLQEGVYRISYHRQGEVGLERLKGQIGDAYGAWINPAVLTPAQGIFVISGDFSRTAAKYGSRAALFVPLEAGHAAQNLLLAACELKFGVVELGGFIEERLSALLQHPKNMMPLLTIAYGALGDPAATMDVDNADFRWVDTGRIEYASSFFLGTALSAGREPERCWAWSADPQIAYTKTLAEACERSACAAPKELYFARCAELEHALSPERILAYSDAQYRRVGFPFAPFDPDGRYAWVDGEDHVTGKRVAVLADFVYYGSAMVHAADGMKPYTTANTSGVAAFPTSEGALERAVLELVERHAFMAVWLHGITTPAIEIGSMPTSIQQRIGALRNAGFTVVIKDFSFVGVPVVFVFAQSLERTMTRVGACAAYEPEAALDHALAEVESGITVQLGMKSKSPMLPAAVRTPADHALLYAAPKYFKVADRLAIFDETTTLHRVGAGCVGDWQSLCDFLATHGLAILKFQLADGVCQTGLRATPSLAVTRAIIPGLIPISFGYDTEPLAASPLAMPASPRGRDVTDMTRPLFPHPFA